jgi:hypothetical protein
MLQSIHLCNHECKNRFSRSDGFCYDSASTSPPVANRANNYCDLPQQNSSGEDLCQFVLAARAMVVRPLADRSRICKGINLLEAESWQKLPDLENQFLHRWMCYSTDCSFMTGNF